VGDHVRGLGRWFIVVRRCAHGCVVDLERDVRIWINEWNNDPRPFIWTKTADEILDTPHRLLPTNERVGTLGYDHGNGALQLGVDGYVAKVVSIAGRRAWGPLAEKPQPARGNQFLD